MKYRKVLFVCSGNMCRSPMAKAIFEDMVGKDPELRSTDISTKSAGTLSLGQQRATDKAIQVMSARGLDISGHRSRHIDGELVDWADVILVMGLEHKQYVLGHFSHTRAKPHLLTEFAGEEGDIPDPMPYGIEVYYECADRLASLLSAMLGRMNIEAGI